MIKRRAGHFFSGKQKRFVNFMEHVDITDAYGAYRIAVVRIAEIDKLLFFGPAFKLPVLKSNFNGSFNSGRTVIRIKNFI